jgi:hypothetical protein
VKARTTTAADEHNATSSSRNLMVGYGIGVVLVLVVLVLVDDRFR